MLKIDRINETRGENGTREIQREKRRSAHLNTDTLHYLPDVGLMCNYKRVQLTLYIRCTINFELSEESNGRHKDLF